MAAALHGAFDRCDANGDGMVSAPSPPPSHRYHALHRLSLPIHKLPSKVLTMAQLSIAAAQLLSFIAKMLLLPKFITDRKFDIIPL